MRRLALAFACLATPALAQQHGHTQQPYAGFEQRAIKSLSPDDIAEIESGGGWGLALPAELSGKPGPAHVLELREDLQLTPAQVAAIETIHAQMKTEAIAAGARFLAAEKALSDAFTADSLDPLTLQALLDAAADARAALRFVHLSRHLETPALLTPHQVARYNQLRGYAADPCSSVPEGHAPEMWRKHNNCD
ncbi:periplasmic heavy metal sensor [Marimonas arenosa]|uniref:Periplasmic heavy metal sensor n=1 Tax=Marimonas arenosa TaxID=1795305 RepID=A0AAE4B4M3_9RHOB|nr:periplasmic heavy metal sensor [Marimonas arenosa]MDQ2091203.1 periplasmic heavy metal sensor [Marimonas arenosa]